MLGMLESEFENTDDARESKDAQKPGPIQKTCLEIGVLPINLWWMQQRQFLRNPLAVETIFQKLENLANRKR